MLTIGRAAPLLLAAIAALTYAAAAVAISSARTFWVDEVLAVWAARLPSAADTTNAIWNGAEFSPPTYDLMLRYVFSAAGADLLTARLPSICAILAAAALIAYLVGKRLGVLFGALAFALILNSALFDYAIQARAYALLAALLAVGLVLWSACGAHAGIWRPAGLAAALFVSVSLHFYAVISFALFALMELLWSLAHRRLRPAIWIALGAGGISCGVWLPLIRRHAGFNANDSVSPEFYGAPTLGHLVEHAHALFIGANAFWLFVLAALLLIASAHVLARSIGKREQDIPADRNGETDLLIIGAGLLAALPIGFAIAMSATHVFSARYALAATLGAAILFVLAIARTPYRAAVAYPLLILLCILPLMRGAPGDLSAAAAQLLKAHPARGPIVIGDGNFFMEMMEAADSDTRTRLVYLRRPAGVVDGDTSAQNQLMRLKNSFRPDLPVRDFDAFVRENRSFDLLARPGKATDALSAWLVDKGWIVGAAAIRPTIALLQARAPN